MLGLVAGSAPKLVTKQPLLMAVVDAAVKSPKLIIRFTLVLLNRTIPEL